MFRSFRLYAVAAAATFALACDGVTSPRGTGELTLLLTDAPGDVLSAVVTIDQIYLQPSEDSDAQRIILRDEDVITDLLTLADSTASLIEGVEIPEGAYGQLRFVISGAYIAVEGETADDTLYYASTPDYAALPEGVTVDGVLIMPSLAQTGIKVNLPNDAIVIAEDGVVVLVVDFDVAQSFGQAAGMSGNWVMTPVLNGFVPNE